MREGVRELAEPTKPPRIFSSAQAGLPPAASFQSCMVWVSDLKVLAVSDGALWYRTDTGAAI